MIQKSKTRYVLTVSLMIMFGVFIGFASVATADGSPVPALIALFISAPIVAYLVGLIWRYDLVPHDQKAVDTEHSEKRKRQAIDDVLRDLSDEDLLHLRHRLQDGSINDEVLYDHLEDDGEYRQSYKR